MFNNTVASITASLSKQVTLLRELSEREASRATKDEEQAASFAASAAERRAEAAKAASVATKINALLD